MEIKTTTINGRKVSYTETEIMYNNKKEVVKIKKLSFGEMLDLNQMSSKLTYNAGQTNIQFDSRAMSENCLLKGIMEAPFQINIQTIRDLEREVGEQLVNVFNELNTPTDKKKEI